MRTIETVLYKFEEHPRQDLILTNYWDINVYYDWWNYIYEDANDIGLKITEFNIDKRICTGNLTEDGEDVAEKIINEHGNKTRTYKAAKDFQAAYALLHLKYPYDYFEDELEEIEADLKENLCRAYLQILKDAYEYLTDEEQIKETLIANDYEFTIDGNIY